MSMRISSAAIALLLLAGCHDKPTAGNVEPAEVAKVTVPCALGGATAFASDCTIEREASAAGVVLTLHHPDGGFRRLTVTSDGRGVAATDGAQPAIVSIADGGQIEVSIGRDRYRLPATIKATRPA